MGILEQASMISEAVCRELPDDNCELYHFCVGCPAKIVGEPLAKAGFRHHSDSAKEIFRDIEIITAAMFEGRVTWAEYWEQFEKLRELHEGKKKDYYI